MGYTQGMENPKKSQSLIPAGSANSTSLVAFEACVPPLIAAAGPQASKRFLEFFTAQIRNKNTRMAYGRAVAGFCSWAQTQGFTEIVDLEPIHVAAWLEARMTEVSAPTVKQELAAVRRLFDWMVTGHFMVINPADAVRGPAHSVAHGKTPILTATQARKLIETIPTTSIVGLRDRALIGMMVYTFARISAALRIDAGDVFRQDRRLRVRLHEKGGKVHEMPCHHRLEGYLLDYVEAAGFDGSAPLFQTVGRGSRNLSGRRLTRRDALYMVKRRAKQAGVDTAVCNHTFRGTGITAYLEHPDAKLEEAQKMAAHSDPKTTRLYDRRQQAVSQDEVERIRI